MSDDNRRSLYVWTGVGGSRLAVELISGAAIRLDGSWRTGGIYLADSSVLFYTSVSGRAKSHTDLDVYFFFFFSDLCCVFRLGAGHGRTLMVWACLCLPFLALRRWTSQNFTVLGLPLFAVSLA